MTLFCSGARLRICIGAAIAAAVSGTSAQAAMAIRNAPTHNVSCSADICTATAGYAVMNAGDLTSMLASSDVTLVSGKRAKDIKVETTFTWATTSRLTLDSYRSIQVNRMVTVAGSGALTLTSNDGGAGGSLIFTAPGNATFWNLSSSLIINGASYTLVNNIATLASEIAADPSGHYALANDYDATPDGTYASSPIPTHFTGYFEGLGNRISNLTVIDIPGETEVGFFSWIDTGGVTENVGLSALTVRGGYASAVGGLAGVNEGLIANSFAIGRVTGGSRNDLGVLVGENGDSGRVVSSHSAGIARAKRESAVGGLFGAGGSVLNSYSTAKVTAESGYCGGLIGLMGGPVTGSWASGAVTIGDNPFGGANYNSAGGLIGQFFGASYSPSTIANSYATGAVSGGQNADVGGLIGSTYYVGSYSGPITYSYSTGAVVGAAGSYIGGFVGYDAKQANTDDYWDTDTSGISDPSQGAGNIANDPGITGLTDTQLKSGLPAGFDPAIWAENPGINGGLPYLIANPPQ